ncbi:unnamed protein product, partial [Symbiodinium natans]
MRQAASATAFLCLLVGSHAVHREPEPGELLAFEVESGGNLVRREGVSGPRGDSSESLAEEGEATAGTTTESVTAEQKSLADAVEAVEELFDEGGSTTTTGSDSIEDLEKTEAESELSNSDRDQIATKVHDQMQDKVRGERGWLRWDQVAGANSTNATSPMDLLWSHEHKECLETENIWTPLSMPEQSRTDEPDHISCRARCLAVRGCAHWSYYLGGGSCYLQNSSAEKTAGKGAVSGIPGCRDKDPSIHLGMNVFAAGHAADRSHS